MFSLNKVAPAWRTTHMCCSPRLPHGAQVAQSIQRVRRLNPHNCQRARLGAYERSLSCVVFTGAGLIWGLLSLPPPSLPPSPMMYSAQVKTVPPHGNLPALQRLCVSQEKLPAPEARPGLSKYVSGNMRFLQEENSMMLGILPAS